MSSQQEQSTLLTISKSAPQISNSQTTYNFYENKYSNFIAHVDKISVYYEKIKTWSDGLKKISLNMFIQLSESRFKKASNYHENGDMEARDEEAEKIMLYFAMENDFDPSLINDDDLTKLIKYAILFSIMLAF